MKKSDIYKYALVATMSALAEDEAYGTLSATEIYEVVREISERIDLELLQERKDERGQGGNVA